MEDIRILVKLPGKPWELRTVPDTLESYQSLVGGYIETVTLASDLVLVCNEEGLLLDLPSNPWIGNEFRGTILLVGRDECGFCDVPERYRCLYKEGAHA